MSQSALDTFGNLLMREVRDRAIGDWERLLSCEVKSNRGQSLCATLSEDEKRLLSLHAPTIVDTTLYWLLCFLESEMGVRLCVDDKGKCFNNLADCSDGLSGELYTEDGWIARFSQKPYEAP